MKPDPGPQIVELACIAELRKNSRETLRITLDQFNGVSLVSIRVWERDRGGELRATKSGVTCRVQMLPKLTHAVGRAFEKAHRRGLILSEYRPPPDARNPALGAGSRELGHAAKPTVSETTEPDTRSQGREQP
jgi:hypothetical protein